MEQAGKFHTFHLKLSQLPGSVWYITILNFVLLPREHYVNRKACIIVIVVITVLHFPPMCNVTWLFK